MGAYVTGETIRRLREQKRLTQKQLAELLTVSDKAVSKWETGKGLPDIALLEPLAAALGVSVAELLSGECAVNDNRAGNMRRPKFYVCPACGNVLTALGEGSFSCCGITLPMQEAEECETGHLPVVELVDNELFVSIEHPMSKEHYISFVALVSVSGLYLQKLYPEQNAELRFPRIRHGQLYFYCNQHGLFQRTI